MQNNSKQVVLKICLNMSLFYLSYKFSYINQAKHNTSQISCILHQLIAPNCTVVKLMGLRY